MPSTEGFAELVSTALGALVGTMAPGSPVLLLLLLLSLPHAFMQLALSQLGDYPGQYIHLLPNSHWMTKLLLSLLPFANDSFGCS